MKRLLWFFVALPLFAQQTATLTGTVRDTTGAGLAGATVSLTYVDRNQTRETTSDASGRFRFLFVPPGDYTLIATMPAFAEQRRPVRLTAGAAIDIPLSLPLGENVTVIAQAPIVETARTEVVSTITPEEVRDLPLNGRNYLDLALLAPGVSRTNTGANQRFAETSAVPGTGISVSTQRNLANAFLVDGLSATDDAAELAGTFFSQEVIREFTVVRSSGTAELGRASAGVINIVTQTGTNAFRGSVYAFLRNDRLDAANALAGTKLPLDQRQYGLSIGGPIARDRTFFFTNVERMRQRGAGVITIAPANVAAINARLDAAGYRGPRIETGSFDTTLDTTNVFARFDHALSVRSQLTARLNGYDVTSDNARSAGGLNAVSRGSSLSNEDRTIAASNLWTISNSAISETRAQMTRSRLDAPPNDFAGPAVNIAGVANFGTATFSPTARDIDLAEVVQHVTLLRGAHAVKGGIDLLRNEVVIDFPGALQGVYSFPSLAAFLAGQYSTFQQAFGEPRTRQANDNFAVFLQDEWRAAPRVTVQAGLRYDVQHLPLVNTDRDNLAPRLGISWDVRGDGRSVLRAAAGVYYLPIPLRAVANALQRNGTTYRIAQVGPGTLTFPNVFAAYPAGVPVNITTIDPDIESGRTEQASIQYERQLATATSLSIGYEHLRGRDIILSRRFGTNTQFQSVGDSWCDGITLALWRRPVAWGSFRVAYTFSKGLDTSGNFFFSQPQDANDVAAERGRSDNDQRHRLTLSGTLSARAWQLSYVFAYTSALPFNVQLPNDRNGDGNFNDRPPGVGRNSGEGFDHQSLDLRLSRTFALRGVNAQLLVDAFNVLNRANYQVPNNIVTSPTFGQATAVNDPRQVQVGVRVTY